MKKIICNAVYDTETAEMIERHTSGCFGDPKGYEETLYRTSDGKYFLYLSGGAESPYPKENIKRLSKEKAKEFLFQSK